MISSTAVSKDSLEFINPPLRTPYSMFARGPCQSLLLGIWSGSWPFLAQADDVGSSGRSGHRADKRPSPKVTPKAEMEFRYSPCKIFFVGEAGFPLIHDRGVNGVLEQIRIHNSNVPVEPWRYAEVDT